MELFEFLRGPNRDFSLFLRAEGQHVLKRVEEDVRRLGFEGVGQEFDIGAVVL